MVDDEDVWLEGGELAVEGDGEEEVDMAKNGAENSEAGQDGRRDEGVAADADVEGAVAAFVEAVGW